MGCTRMIQRWSCKSNRIYDESLQQKRLFNNHICAAIDKDKELHQESVKYFHVNPFAI